jgi:hypothetical protein
LGRVQLLCFFFGDDIELEADIFRAAFEVLEPFLFDPGETLADTSCLVKYRFLAGFLRQDFVVELDRVVVDLRDGVVTDEVRTQAGGVPGGAAGQFAFFDQHHVAPAFFGQVVEQVYPE